MKLKENLFDLTPEQESMSKTIYNNKIIKCLVAPYHSYEQLEKVVPWTKNTYLFPEREIPINQIKQLVSLIVANPSTEEFRIITTNQNVIMDMIDGCVRVLTEGGDIVPSPCKTFMANIHDIRLYLLENKNHQLTQIENDNIGKTRIFEILNEIEKADSITKEQYEILSRRINAIGEPLIADRLQEMALSKIVKNQRREVLEEELARLNKEENN